MNDSGDYQQLLQELDIEKSDGGEEIKVVQKEEEFKKPATPVIEDDSEDEITKIVGKDVLKDAAPTEIKKTEKIISNQQMDKDEFSYFKKAKPGDNKPKIELDDDFDLFDQGDKKKTMASINQPKDDDFDFEF